MEFVPISAGEFAMGSPLDEEDMRSVEGPDHHLNIEKAFYMGRYEVTQKQWRAKPTLITFIYGPIDKQGKDRVNQPDSTTVTGGL